MSFSRILVVDDDASVTAALELILSAGQFEEITIAANAEDAFEVLGLAFDDPEVPPAVDVIVLDVMMPGVDGIEACARIRRSRRYRDIPIIMCSGMDQIADLNQAFIAGAHDYVTKPVRKIELLARINSALRLKRELDRRRAREAQLRSEQRVEREPVVNYLDPDTGLPNQAAFEVAMHRAASGGQPHGVLTLRIADAELLRKEAGKEAAQDLIVTVARAIGLLHAPLGWRPYIFGEGLFVILARIGSANELEQLGRQAVEAVSALRIIHGHSLTDDFVRLKAASGWASGTELLSLPAKLIRDLENPDHSIQPENHTRVA